jgi:hypothetical protein
MKLHRAGWIAGAVAFVVMAGGCTTFLDVKQTTNPETAAVYQNDQDFEAVIGTLWRVWWGVTQGADTYNGEQTYGPLALSCTANEMTNVDNTGQAFSICSQPRQPYDNDQGGGNFLTRKLYYNTLQCIATAHDALSFLYAGYAADTTLRPIIGNPGVATRGNHTDRARYWTKMMNGVCHIYLGLYMDQGYVVDSTIPKLGAYDWKSHLVPYTDIVAYGVKQLEEAIVMAQNAPLDTIWGGSSSAQSDTANGTLCRNTVASSCGFNSNWLYGRVGPGAVVLNKSDPVGCAGCQHLVEFMHSMIARAFAYNARTAKSRSTNCTGLKKDCTDWTRVNAEALLGVRSNFYVLANRLADSNGDSRYYRYWANTTPFRIDNRLVGPADSAGAFQAWLAAPLGGKTNIIIKTADRRINGAATSSAAGYKVAGTYFRVIVQTSSTTICTAQELIDRASVGEGTAATCWKASQSFTANNGTYMWSIYAGNKYSTTYWQTGTLNSVTAKEMNFLQAEAQIRLGHPELAFPIINLQGRTTVGLLPALTINGPPQGTATEIRSCVPKRADGTCGNLLDALMYEKRIEMSGTEAIIMWADARGWGMLLPGSWCNVPIPNRETQALGLPSYTFGGDSPGSVGQGPALSGASCTDT